MGNQEQEEKQTFGLGGECVDGQSDSVLQELTVRASWETCKDINLPS